MRGTFLVPVFTKLSRWLGSLIGDAGEGKDCEESLVGVDVAVGVQSCGAGSGGGGGSATAAESLAGEAVDAEAAVAKSFPGSWEGEAMRISLAGVVDGGSSVGPLCCNGGALLLLLSSLRGSTGSCSGLFRCLF